MSHDHRDGIASGEPADGIDRRSLIKRAAIAGGAAWIAPVVIDSIASPAGAVTLSGCFRMFSSANNGTWGAWQATQPGGTGPACVPTTAACTATAGTAASFAAVALPTPSVTNGGSQAVTISIASGYPCKIVSASATVETVSGGDANQCRSRTTDGTSGNTAFSGLGTTSVTINPAPSDAWDTNVGGSASSMIGIIIQCV